MPDIISAKCFGCGHVIKVPSGLGGRKARCPQCTNTISIPALEETTDDIVSDAELPEVARDDEILDAKYIEEESLDDPVQEPSEIRRRAGTAQRRGSSTAHPRAGGRATQPRYAEKPKSGNGMMIGIGIAIAAVAIIGLALAAGGGGKNKPSKQGSKDTGGGASTPKQELNEADQQLSSRCHWYTDAVNNGDPDKVIKYYTYSPEEGFQFKRAVNQMIDQKTAYEGVQVKAVSAAAGVTTFTYGGGREKTLNWKQVDGVWLIADKPAP